MLPLVLWEIREERASVILIAPNQPGFPDLTELLEAPPCRSPAGSICYPRWRARCGTRTWNYGAIMCDRFRGIRGDGRLTVSHAHGSAKTLYKTFVCFKMGSVCERVRLISTRLLAPYRMFWVSRCTDWIVDRYHRHWSLCRGHCRVCSPQSGQSFGKKDYIPHIHFRFRPGTRKWVKSSLIATIWAFNIRRFEGAIP